jgi:hypothetical protein
MLPQHCSWQCSFSHLDCSPSCGPKKSETRWTILRTRGSRAVGTLIECLYLFCDWSLGALELVVLPCSFTSRTLFSFDKLLKNPHCPSWRNGNQRCPIVNVAQRVDELLFLYTNIRLRHQRNKTTVGSHSSFISAKRVQR